MAAVKADAYGHGILPISRTAEEEGLDWLGVAIVEEGLTLRSAGIQLPILVLGGLVDGSEEMAVDAGLTPVLYRAASARALAATGRRRNSPLPVHLKLDTGMNRLGVPLAELGLFLDLIEDLGTLRIDGVLTHLAEAENPDQSFTQQQLRDFAAGLAEIRGRGHAPRWIHAANSAAVMMGQKATQPDGANLVRPGIILYGHAPSPSLDRHWPLRPVLNFESAISFLKTVPKGSRVSYGLSWTAERDTRLATLPVGYGDGYFRALGNRAHALVRGQEVPVVGRVCMDLTLLDVTDVQGVEEGDAVVLLGVQGGKTISAGHLASVVDTIPYEVICAISPRVPRVYEEHPVGLAGDEPSPEAGATP